ncbi:MAG TPA: bacillithiol biosynthesis deacetylase BshB1 [Blastocatellia bacterium]|jgi:bacillithiol biosynthesis deacetylase BshB1|nr:bacillithiol biosynthesis deacetylase BshB1 [Blastocatellia bacterium]
MSETPTPLDVLAVFSHPDDAELSVSGTLLKLKSLGYRTGVVDMTRGEMGTRGTPEIRAQEALAAAQIMNLDARLNLELLDGHVWLNEESRKALVRVIRAHRPRLLLTTHWEDPHPDHSQTSLIVRHAARLASMVKYDAEFRQEAVKVPMIMHSLFSRRIVPSFIVDVSDFVETKMRAIKAHSSQFYSQDSTEPATRISDKGFLDEINSRMRYFGSLIGVAAGEPFFVSEALNVADPFALLTRPMNIYS